MDLTEASRLRVTDDVLFQELEGEAVLLELTSGTYFGLDPVGTRIWQLLQEDVHLGGLHDVLCQEFEVSPERLREDLLEFVARLLEKELVEVVDGGNPLG